MQLIFHTKLIIIHLYYALYKILDQTTCSDNLILNSEQIGIQAEALIHKPTGLLSGVKILSKLPYPEQDNLPRANC